MDRPFSSAPAIPSVARAALLIVIGAALTWWTWGRLGDPLIDWGKELHLAWRVSDGAVLYRDVEYLYGPLPVWVNAAWFRLFGASIRTLVLCNAAILAAITIMLYRVLRRFAGPWGATAAGALFLLMFGFGNFVGFANYNYLTPYAHGVTHGAALLLAEVLCLIRWYERDLKFRWISLAGGVAGLTVYTKPEVALAAFAAAAVALPVMLWSARASSRAWVRSAVAFTGAAIAVFVLILGLMMTQLPPRDAVRGLFASYVYALDPQIAQAKFYRVGLGVEHPWRSVRKVVVWCAYYGQVLIPVAMAALVAGKWATRRRAGGTPRRLRDPLVALTLLVTACATFYLVWRARFEVRWADAFRGLTGVILFIDAVLFVAVLRTKSGRAVAALPFAILGTALLAKMALNVRVAQYGFVLAMPATILATVALLDWTPRLLTRAGGDGRIFTAGAAGMLAAVVAVHLQVSQRILAGKDVRLAPGADTIYASGDHGRMLKAAIDELASRARPGDTLAVLPEAATINYLLRLPNPTPFDQLTPIGARVFGEPRVTQSFKDHPPEWIVLVHQDTSIFGGRYLGHDYLRELGEWMEANYVEVWRAGGAPLESLQFGISIRRRR